ncbi:Thioredoxin-like protein [Elusimicrobium minutum Pei191]|uniref:Thioredoxin-like protein n=1 Tax=Elusimicrobium minutum (strain Pei191) TaxID=445932 RepID=B2KB63_ELUMP|nr:NifU family protein [Elusimicrobium minutum]ACC97822.1 Thioredoxin-like protein [Elusimicrobium minutum Pei191]
MHSKIEEVIAKIKPVLQADGGDLEFVSFDENTGTVYVSLKGRCGGCPAAQMTLKAVIERKIMQEIPEVKAVERV